MPGSIGKSQGALRGSGARMQTRTHTHDLHLLAPHICCGEPCVHQETAGFCTACTAWRYWLPPYRNFEAGSSREAAAVLQV